MDDRLFDPVEQREGKVEVGETTFEFLRRGGRKEAIGIRRWIEQWFREFPANQRSHLKSRLKSKDFAEFVEAFFELQVFAMLRRLHCRVEVEPRFPNTAGTVDFLATTDWEKFYVEATVCGVRRGTLGETDAEEDAVQKVKQNLAAPHSDVWLSATGQLRRRLRKTCVVKPFQELLRFTADEVKRLYLEYGAAWAWSHLSDSVEKENWVLHGYLAPPIALDGQGQVRGLGKGGAVDGAAPLADALKRKWDDWKEKKLPKETFLVAVNVCHTEFYWGDQMSAIFGLTYPIGKQDGFSESLSGIDGVIVFDNMVLGAERSARVKMYQNGSRHIPECLRFLLRERRSGDLLGFELNG